MKKYKNLSILNYFLAVLFYVLTIITFIGENENSMRVMWLCLGSAFLCLGSVFLNKSKENNDDSNDDDNKDDKD